MDGLEPEAGKPRQTSKGSALQSIKTDSGESPAATGTLGGGRLLSAISTRFVKLLREHYGTLGWHPWAQGPHPWAGRRGTDRARALVRSLRSTIGAPG